jgi:TIR domain
MIVFISWSGPLSREVAELLASWLPEVIQEVEPWISTRDIQKGSIWSEEINKALATTVGILCVTQDNKNEPWLLFEAGGLFKGLTEARVCPLLIDLEPKDLEQPLSRFQLTVPNKEDIGELLTTINAADLEKGLSKERLQKSFDRLWPEFERAFQGIRSRYAKAAKPPQRSAEDMIVEVLEISRALQRNSERLLEQWSEPVAATIEGGYSGYSGYGRGGHFFLTPEQTTNPALRLYSEALAGAKAEAAKKKRLKEQGTKEERAKEERPEKSD